jgi:flagellar biosynthesis component FlhA
MSRQTFTRQEERQGFSDRSVGLVVSWILFILAIVDHLPKLPISVNSAYFAVCPFWPARPELADVSWVLQ